MASAAAALLDQLMGRSRNAVVGDEVAKDHWSDPDVCKNFLCGFCPSELFTNTKSDIGPCDKIHDEALQIAYTGSAKFGKMGYEDDFLDCLEKTIRDLDKRIQRGKERLMRSAEANKKAFSDEGGMYSEKLHELSMQIADLINQSEELGNQGDVDAAQRLILRVEELEREKERERSAVMFKANVPQTVAGFEIDPGNFHEKNEICDVCGCFLIIGDTQARMDAHLMGKQHMGFSRIRSKIVELRQAREDKMAKAAEERRKRRESQSNREESKEREGRRHRSSSRDRRRRSRSRDKRSRSRDRRRRSRDRGRRSRSRERKRSRDKKHRSRSRQRSKSKERKRSRSRDSKRRRRSRSRERSRRDRKRSRSRERSHRDRHRSRSKSKERKEDNKDMETDGGVQTTTSTSDNNGEETATSNGIEASPK